MLTTGAAPASSSLHMQARRIQSCLLALQPQSHLELPLHAVALTSIKRSLLRRQGCNMLHLTRGGTGQWMLWGVRKGGLRLQAHGGVVYLLDDSTGQANKTSALTLGAGGLLRSRGACSISSSLEGRRELVIVPAPGVLG